MKPQKTKQQMRELAPDGYEYGGFWDDHYHFIAGNYSTGFADMAVNDEDLTDENLAFMAKHKLTRITERS